MKRMIKAIFLYIQSGTRRNEPKTIRTVRSSDLSLMNAVLHKFAKIDMHRSISVMIGKMSEIDSYQHRGSKLRNTARMNGFLTPRARGYSSSIDAMVQYGLSYCLRYGPWVLHKIWRAEICD